MFLIGLQKNEYVIKIDHYKFSEVVLKDKVHEFLKCGRCIAKSKWHPEIFILFSKHYKSGFVNVFLSYLYLPVFCY